MSDYLWLFVVSSINYIRILIQDNGIGILYEDSRRIFDREFINLPTWHWYGLVYNEREYLRITRRHNPFSLHLEKEPPLLESL